MTAIRRITEQRELAELAAQLRMRPDWHEPSEQEEDEARRAAARQAACQEASRG